jgi:hypothetical protein
LLEPFHEEGEDGALVFAEPEDEVEVVGYDDVGEEAELEACNGLFEGGFEGGVVGGGVENLGAGGGAVHDVVDVVAGDKATFAGHGESVGWPGWCVKVIVGRGGRKDLPAF